MWHYSISSASPSSRYIHVSMKASVITDIVEINLPAWRPGRYELQNFAKNVRDFRVEDENGNPLEFSKVSKDKWLVKNIRTQNINIYLEYYSAQLDAGACWCDDDFLYVNPVHCLPYLNNDLHTPCTLKVDVDASWEIACALTQTNKNTLVARDYHELVDSPFIASPNLKHESYTVNNHLFHIWLQGNVNPKWEIIKHDFAAFTKDQLEMMGGFPSAEYHFLVLVLPYRFYHGVEHVTSTVLALGPGYAFHGNELYTDFMGVASHELFHVWNVKTLRPVDFNEYDYSKENYSKLGWVYEGFTTYYGDLFLARSGFFDVKNYFAEVNARLQKHFDNAARFRYSVADSSYDTWLDGYVQGAPYRKTNIYDEGSIIAMMMDLYIRRSSNNKFSLDDLFKRLYYDFAPNHRGYKESDLLTLAKEFSDENVKVIFDELINGVVSYEPLLNELLMYVGCEVSKTPSKHQQENLFGVRTMQEGGVTKVAAVYPGSPGMEAGISKDDEIIAVNGWKVENNLSDLIFDGKDSWILTIFSQRKLKAIVVKSNQKKYFETIKLQQIKNASEMQVEAFKSWTRLS